MEFIGYLIGGLMFAAAVGLVFAERRYPLVRMDVLDRIEADIAETSKGAK